MQKGKGSELQKTLNHFLLRYRTTPHPSTEKALKRSCLVEVSKPDLIYKLHPREALKRQSVQKTKPQSREFTKDDMVWIRNYHGSPRWLPGQITAKLGPLNYKVKVRGQTWKRQLDQLRLRHIPVTVTDFIEIPSSTPHKDSRPIPPVICGLPERRYPIRDNRQPPDRLTY